MAALCEQCQDGIERRIGRVRERCRAQPATGSHAVARAAPMRLADGAAPLRGRPVLGVRCGGQLMPEIKKIEPIVRVAAAQILQNARIPDLWPLVSRARGCNPRIAEIRQLLDDDPISIAAAVQAGEKHHRPAQQRRGAPGSDRKLRRRTQEIDTDYALVRQRAISQNANEGTLFEARANSAALRLCCPVE